MLRIPTQAVPVQTFSVTLARQASQIALRQNGDNLYFDLKRGDEYIVRTRLCRNRSRLLVDAGYRGYQGDFLFVDTQGSEDPDYTGLGGRFQLIYLEAGE